MNQICQICFSQKRKLRFHTEEISVCKNCINEATSSETYPEEILKNIKKSILDKKKSELQHSINLLESKRLKHPSAVDINMDEIYKYNEKLVKQKQGFFQSIYSDFVDGKKRDSEVWKLCLLHKEKILSDFSKKNLDYEKTNKEVDNLVEVERNKYKNIEELVELEMKREVESIMEPKPIKSKDFKHLRFYYFGLINFNLILSKRPESLNSDEQKKIILSRDKYRCMCCLRGYFHGELHVHHIIPLYQRGTNNDCNLVTLCHICHQKQHPEFKINKIQDQERPKPKRKKSSDKCSKQFFLDF